MKMTRQNQILNLNSKINTKICLQIIHCYRPIFQTPYKLLSSQSPISKYHNKLINNRISLWSSNRSNRMINSHLSLNTSRTFNSPISLSPHNSSRPSKSRTNRIKLSKSLRSSSSSFRNSKSSSSTKLPNRLTEPRFHCSKTNNRFLPNTLNSNPFNK